MHSRIHRWFIALLGAMLVMGSHVALAQGTAEPATNETEGTAALGRAGASDQVEAWIKGNLGDVQQVEPPSARQAARPEAALPAALQPGGSLDWSSGAMVYTAEEVVAADSMSPARHRGMGLRRATLRARKALLDAVEQLPLDGRRTVADALSAAELAAVRAYLQNSRLQQREEIAEDGSLHLFVSALVTLRGDFAELLMPGDEAFLGGVPSTIALTTTTAPAPVRDPKQAAYRKSMADLGGFTGLVVDARGLANKPAFLPVVADPSGLTAYGPFQVSRAAVAASGLVIYTKNPKGNMLRARVGKSPLTVRALAVSGVNRADFVISYEDAILVRTLFKNQDVKNYCRVVILSD